MSINGESAMSAVFSIKEDQVVVSVNGALNYDVWPILRDARDQAHEKHAQLCIDVEQCSEGDMAGIGSILLAQEKLPAVKLTGCHGVFYKCFHHFGICAHCSVTNEVKQVCEQQRQKSADLCLMGC